MNHNEFLQQIHRRIAIVSVGGSAIRNQGAAGLVDIARFYFENSVSLDKLFACLRDEGSFKQFLDYHTEQLVQQFPKGGKSWGASRKGFNLFFRDLVYNKFIAEKYGLSRDFETFNDDIKHLEVPLDSYVANRLYKRPIAKLPKWSSIKTLTPAISDQYQDEALIDAMERKVARVHLDLIYWGSPSE